MKFGFDESAKGYIKILNENRHEILIPKPREKYIKLQGATARNSVEWFVFAAFCFVTTFAIVPEVSITLVMQ